MGTKLYFYFGKFTKIQFVFSFVVLSLFELLLKKTLPTIDIFFGCNKGLKGYEDILTFLLYEDILEFLIIHL